METTTTHDVVTILISQHEHAKQLMNQIAAAPADERRDPFEALVRLLAVHETSEEEVVHPFVSTLGADASSAVRTCLDEESAAKKAQAELEGMDPASDEFLAAFLTFQRDVEVHATREQAEIFPLVKEHRTAEQRQNMGRMLEAAQRIAPTHAHRFAPQSALGNLIVGPAVAVVDRVRDAIRDSRRSD